ncbi:MAG: DUF1553 domain-containing protein [Gemmataceae bacterium]|nr:DUF1553 domain-containing protein [Gemmataceae bacterium]
MLFSNLVLLILGIPPDPGGFVEARAILKERCFPCHGALKQKAGLRLDSASFILKGSEQGAVATPGKPDESPLIQRVKGQGKLKLMPPEGKPLKPEEIETLASWIRSGMKAPKVDIGEDNPALHWAFSQPKAVEPPAVANPQWNKNPIDRFLYQAMIEKGVAPAGLANPETLLRRVTFDLTGLPPTVEELERFHKDPSPKAYEAVVDRLLASSAYGERWGRHWLDVWRYSDWYGRRNANDILNSYPMIWRWRDWTVNSLNQGKPYDRMVMEMLAGDELAPLDREVLPATGFVLRNHFRWNYNRWMRDMVEHTGKAFLGLTIQCAHCHDHKYDPVSQADYFRLRAFFEPLQVRHDRYPGEAPPRPFKKYVVSENWAPFNTGLVRVFDEGLESPTWFYTGGDERNRVKEKGSISPGVPAFLAKEKFAVHPVKLPKESVYPGLQEFIRQEEREARATAVAKAQEGVNKTQGMKKKLAEAQLTAARLDEKSLFARLAADDARWLGKGDAVQLAGKAAKSEKELNLVRAELALLQAEDAPPKAPTKQAKKAAAPVTQDQAIANAKKAVDAAKTKLNEESISYTPLTPVYPEVSSGRRLALAQWIVQADNPLTARVAVNHLWKGHFVEPLVATTADFGRNGARPTHPQLLDWLAMEFMKQGWKMKPLHRLMVTSRGYQSSSSQTEEALQANKKTDPNNRLLWVFPSRRLEAEAVRDAILAVSGNLDRSLGGKEIHINQGMTTPRRSIYFAHHGEGQMEFSETFDGANTNDCYRRVESVRPQQALALANSALAREEGARFSRRIQALNPADNQRFIHLAFQLALSRKPNAEEMELSLRFLQGSGKELELARHDFCQALFSHPDFTTLR